MSLRIAQGLFNLDFTDHHAILGVPVDADVKDVRKQYLKIARRLHPDSYATEDEADRQLAIEFLSKLVNPAYEKLSQERNYAEYIVLLRLKGQQAVRQQETVVLMGDRARKLATTGDLEQSYHASLKELAEKQYTSLGQTLEVTGQISELNLVYLMRKQASGDTISQINRQSQQTTGTTTRAPTPPPKPAPPSPKVVLVEGYMRRARELEAKQDFGKAIMELREALQLDPTNSNCHSRLGVIYFKTNQATMAKIHFNQALKLNPQDPVALEGKRRLDPSSGSQDKAQQPNSKGSKSDKSGGGLFGLFGKK